MSDSDGEYRHDTTSEEEEVNDSEEESLYIGADNSACSDDEENNDQETFVLKRNNLSKLQANPEKKKKYIPIGTKKDCDRLWKSYEKREENKCHLTPSWINHFIQGVQSVAKEKVRIYAGDTTIEEINGSNKMLYAHKDNETPFNHDAGRKKYANYLQMNLNDMRVDIPKCKEEEMLNELKPVKRKEIQKLLKGKKNLHHKKQLPNVKLV